MQMQNIPWPRAGSAVAISVDWFELTSGGIEIILWPNKSGVIKGRLNAVNP